MAPDAVHRYGHNVDSGAIQWMLAVGCLGPLAFLFALASLALARNWRIGAYVHGLAVLAVVAIPFADYLSTRHG